jgi:hypothetical protein
MVMGQLHPSTQAAAARYPYSCSDSELFITKKLAFVLFLRDCAQIQIEDATIVTVFTPFFAFA